jgi:hypothetical protein
MDKLLRIAVAFRRQPMIWSSETHDSKARAQAKKLVQAQFPTAAVLSVKKVD